MGYENMPYEAYNDCVYIIWNKNKDGELESVQVRDEVQMTHKSICILEGIPDEYYHVKIDGMREVKNKVELDDDEFIVDYVYGLIRFSNNMDNKKIVIKEYYSRGNYYYPSNRIYYEISPIDGKVVTMYDIINKIRDELEIINAIALETNKTLTDTNSTALETNDILKESIALAEQKITQLGIEQFVKFADTGNESGKIPINNGNLNVNLNAEMIDGKKIEQIADKIHTHTKSNIIDFPTSLPANGGNADTVDGKHASDLANIIHTHTKSNIIDMNLKTVAETGNYNDLINKPTSLPANGGNADTLGNRNAKDFIQNSDNTNTVKMKYDKNKKSIVSTINNNAETEYVEKAKKADIATTAMLLDGLNADSYGQQTTKNVTFYVNPIIGDDNNNDGLSSTRPFKTIQHVLDICPKILRHLITIKLSEGEYYENIKCGGYVGEGGIIIAGDTTNRENLKLKGVFQINRVFSDFKLDNIRFDFDPALTSKYVVLDEFNRTVFYPLRMDNCFSPFIYNCDVTQNGISVDYISGIYTRHSHLRVQNTKVRNMKGKIRGTGIFSTNGSDTFCWSCDVNGTKYCYYTQTGTIRVYRPILPPASEIDYEQVKKIEEEVEYN